MNDAPAQVCGMNRYLAEAFMPFWAASFTIWVHCVPASMEIHTAGNPDVWISMLAGTQCTQIVNEAAQNGMKASAKYLFMPQTCAGASFISKEKLGGDGSAGDGWWLLSNGAKDTKDPAFANDPYVQWLKTE